MKKCKIFIKDEVNCNVQLLRPSDIELLYEEFGAFASNYFFAPKYKLGQWDGKIRFFTRQGKTYTNLLPSIVPILVEAGYDIEISDNRSKHCVTPSPITQNMFDDILHPRTGKPIELRDYQVEAVNLAFKQRNGVIVAGTGAGKSFINGALVKQYYNEFNFKSITIVPSIDLVSQTAENLRLLGLEVGEYGDSKKELNNPHIVSTWQSLMSSPALLQDKQLLILDECHGARGKVIQDLLLNHGNNIQYRFGLTGTIPTELTDQIAIRITIGDVFYRIPAHKLIERKVLSDVHISVVQYPVDLTKQYEQYLSIEGPIGKKLSYDEFKLQYLPDFAAEKKFVQTEKNRFGHLVELLEERKGKGNAFILVNGIAFGKKLAKALDVPFVHGKDKKAVRKEIYDTFDTNNDVMVIASIQIAAVGLDIPRIFCLVFVDIGKSFVRVIQTIGRGLRKAEDKDFIEVLDCCTDLKYSRIHLRERKKYYNKEKFPFTVKKVN